MALQRHRPTHGLLRRTRPRPVVTERRPATVTRRPVDHRAHALAALHFIHTNPMDRRYWRPGPWDNEPDRAEWVDIATGLPCLAKRNHHGAWCGYVGVAPGHPLYGVDYNDADLQAHGGLTYAAACWTHEDGTPDHDGVCHRADDGDDRPRWWFGFDCLHHMDCAPGFAAAESLLDQMAGRPRIAPPWPATYRTLTYVRRECRGLARQLERIERGALGFS